jgi:hypothetical protein
MLPQWKKKVFNSDMTNYDFLLSYTIPLALTIMQLAPPAVDGYRDLATATFGTGLARMTGISILRCYKGCGIIALRGGKGKALLGCFHDAGVVVTVGEARDRRRRGTTKGKCVRVAEADETGYVIAVERLPR